MSLKSILLQLTTIILLSACSDPKDSNDGNGAAEGFDFANSDPAAVELADSIMVAMGGRENWDNTRYISWNFFGNRNLVWDKRDERVRIESIKDSITYIVNLKSLAGKVWVKGQELTEKDSLNKMLNKAKSIWINDSY